MKTLCCCIIKSYLIGLNNLTCYQLPNSIPCHISGVKTENSVGGIWEEEFIMEKRHKDLLRKNRVGLVEDLDPMSLLSYLFQEQTLSENDVELIKAEKTRSSQAEKLLDVVPKRGPKAFDTFCRALERTDGQGHLVALLKSAGSAPQGMNEYASNSSMACLIDCIIVTQRTFIRTRPQLRCHF